MQSYINDKRYVPSSCNGHYEHKQANCEIFYTVGEVNGKFYAIGYSGKRKNHDFHFSFKTEERMKNYIDNYVAEKLASVKYAAELKAKAKAMQKEISVKVGDMFCYSWGYDQTNVDFYQVVELKGKQTIIVREICGKQVEGSSGFMSCQMVAAKDTFKRDSKPMIKRIRSGYNGKACFSMEFGSAWLTTETESHYCSWYA